MPFLQSIFAGHASRYDMSHRGMIFVRPVDEIRSRIKMKDPCDGRGLDITVDHAPSMSPHNVRYIRVLKYNVQTPM